MAIKETLENAFVQKVLEHVLDGDKGSTLLTAILTPVVAANMNWALVLRGLHFQDLAGVQELAKLAGLLLVAIWGWRVGKKKPAAK